MNIRLKRPVFGLLCVLMLLLCGCALRPEKDADAQGGNSGENSPRTYSVYYTNADQTALVEKKYTPEATSFDGVVKELMQQLQTPPSPDVQSAVPEGVKLKGMTMGVDNLTVDIDAGYLSLNSNVQRVLLQAAVVKTLASLPGVYTVSLTVDGQPMREEGGEIIPPMAEDSFIDSGSDGINSYRSASLELYYPRQDGTGLGYEKRNVIYSSNLTMERVVVEQIIGGPRYQDLRKVTGSECIIRSVRISKNVCIVDMNEAFNNPLPQDGPNPELCLYSLVNSICAAIDVRGVQVRIDGETDLRFRGQVSLDQVFEPRMDLVVIPGLETETQSDGTGTTESEAQTEQKKDQGGSQGKAEKTTEGSTKPETESETAAPQQGSAPSADGDGAKQHEERSGGPALDVGVDPSLMERGSA